MALTNVGRQSNGSHDCHRALKTKRPVTLPAALEREGFTVEWDGTIKTRLFVKGFRWQRRSPWRPGSPSTDG